MSRACRHITNYTTAHESLPGAVGVVARFDYPPKHIEIDPRLPWFLGELGRRFPGAFYVHLIRDPEAVAQSIARRWGGRASFARAFGEAMLMRGDLSSDPLEIARFQVSTMTANIELFLRALHPASNAPHMTAQLEHSGGWFPEFWSRIKAKGNVDKALAEFTIHYNASPVKHES